MRNLSEQERKESSYVYSGIHCDSSLNLILKSLFIKRRPILHTVM